MRDEKPREFWITEQLTLYNVFDTKESCCKYVSSIEESNKTVDEAFDIYTTHVIEHSALIAEKQRAAGLVALLKKWHLTNTIEFGILRDRALEKYKEGEK